MHGPSGIENILRNVILVDFPEVVCEKRFGRFRVDAYLPPPYHLAFEADGEHWHNKKYDKKRDAELMKRFGLPVVRMSEQELNGVAR